MFSIISKIVIGSFLYGVIILGIATYLPEMGLIINNEGQYGTAIMVFLIGVIFFLVNRILKKAILVFKLPLNILTLGFGSFLINILMLYVFVLSINYLTTSTGISIQVGSLLQVIILAIVLALVDILVQAVK